MTSPRKAFRTILRGVFKSLWLLLFTIISGYNYLVALYSGKENYHLYAVIFLTIGFLPLVLSIFLKIKK